MLPYILLIAGFAVLIKGADFLVDGATSISRRFNISDLVIGLTVVAFGTSSPELFVNLVASVKGNTVSTPIHLGYRCRNHCHFLAVFIHVYRQKALFGPMGRCNLYNTLCSLHHISRRAGVEVI